MRPMLYVILFVVICTLCGSILAATPKPACDIDLMVETLRQIENWDGRSLGAAGERGPWQFTPDVWHQYSTLPFSCAEGKSNAEKTEQRRVAREVVFAISERVKAARRTPDAYTVALIWGAGWSAYYYGQPHKPSAKKRDYAQRAENLYIDLLKSHP